MHNNLIFTAVALSVLLRIITALESFEGILSLPTYVLGHLPLLHARRSQTRS